MVKVLLVLRFPDTPTRRRKTHNRIILSRSELTLVYSKKFLRWNTFWFCPLSWNVDGMNMRESPNIILIMSIFKLRIRLSYRYKVFRQGLPLEIFWKIWVSCRSDLLYARSSVTAPHCWKISQCDCGRCSNIVVNRIQNLYNFFYEMFLINFALKSW